jgi:hypothetical protein
LALSTWLTWMRRKQRQAGIPEQRLLGAMHSIDGLIQRDRFRWQWNLAPNWFASPAVRPAASILEGIFSSLLMVDREHSALPLSGHPEGRLQQRIVA